MVSFYLRETGKKPSHLRERLRALGASERVISRWLQSGPPFKWLPYYGEFFGVPWQHLVHPEDVKEVDPETAHDMHLLGLLDERERAAIREVMQLMLVGTGRTPLG